MSSKGQKFAVPVKDLSECIEVRSPWLHLCAEQPRKSLLPGRSESNQDLSGNRPNRNENAHDFSRCESNSARFRFVSDIVMHAAEKCDPMHNEPLKRSLQINLQRIFNREYDPAVFNLRYSVRETQSPAAYLLLAEAYAQAGQTELALATLDVLQCVEPDRSDAEMMKSFLVPDNDNCAKEKKCFQAAVKPRMPLRTARNTLAGIFISPERACKTVCPPTGKAEIKRDR